MKTKGNGAKLKQASVGLMKLKRVNALIPLYRKCLMVGSIIPVIFAPLEHEEDGAQHFMTQGHDGAFVPASHEQRLEPCLESRGGTAGGMSELAQKATAQELTLRTRPDLHLPADSLFIDPRNQTIRTAKNFHIGTDFYQQHCRADKINAGQGLQVCSNASLIFD